MFINGIDIKELGASVSSKLIQPSEIVIEKNKIKLYSAKVSNKTYYKKMDLKLLFQGDNRDVIYKNISNFTSEISDECKIKFKNLSNEFQCYINNSSIEETGLNEWVYLNLSFDCLEIGSEVITTINRITSKTINVAGNQVTPAIVEITPSIALVDLTITGLDEDFIKIKNITASKKIIINGEDGTVIVDGANKYGDTEMWGFPSLKPGVNTITVDKSSVDITIKYKPRYI